MILPKDSSRVPGPSLIVKVLCLAIAILLALVLASALSDVTGVAWFDPRPLLTKVLLLAKEKAHVSLLGR